MRFPRPVLQSKYTNTQTNGELVCEDGAWLWGNPLYAMNSWLMRLVPATERPFNSEDDKKTC